MKQTTFFVLLAIFLFIGITPAFALEKEAGATASLSATFGNLIVDKRVTHLTNYLEAVNSPMAPEAEHFVREADRLTIDWKLVAAIAGVESYFGRRIPANSYNAWGWAIFTGTSDGRHFEGWKDGITQVSEGLKEKYINRGLDTIEKMSPVYAADPSWAWKVQHFMNEIEAYQPDSTSELSIAL